MNIKLIITAFAAALAVCDTLAADAKAKTIDRNSPEAKAARYERRMRKTGGFLNDYRGYKGQFLFLNSQSLVQTNEIAELTIGTMKDFFMCKFGIVPAEKFDIAKAAEQMKKADAQAAVFLVDDPALPTLLAAPESSWGVVNVAKLAADKPERDLLAQRVRREMWRALAYVLGFESPADVCVVKQLSTLKELDALEANALSQYPLTAIQMRLPKVGIGAIRIASYKSACEEGWAPAPTNDYQKAIWNQIHEIPTNPIQIKFDPKKGK